MVLKSAVAAGALSMLAVRQADVLNSLNLSNTCQSTILALNTSSVATCLNVNGFFNIVSTPFDQSWAAPIESWDADLCAAPACTTSDLNSAFDSLTTGCAADLTAAEVTSEDVSVVRAAVTTYYPTVHKLLCLRDSSAGNQLCVKTWLDGIEKYIGKPLSPNNVIATLPTILSGNNGSYPTDLICSKCTKAAYQIVKQDIPDVGQYDVVFNTLCGSDFTANSTSSEVSVVTGTAARLQASTTGSSAGSSSTSPSSNSGDSLVSSTAMLFGSAISTIVGALLFV